MTALRYIIEVIICSGLFLVIYRWLLARKVDFGLCRAFIMTSMILAVAIPALNVPVFPERKTAERIVLTGLYLIEDEPGITEAETAAAETETVTATGNHVAKKAIDLKAAAGKTANVIYILIALASLCLTAYNTIKIARLRRRSKLTHTDAYTLAEHEDIKTPFSFIRTIFMGFNYEQQERMQILTHEASHVRHRHSYERLFMSVLRSIFWFNPFFWMAEKDLEEVQEWEADKDVLDEGWNLKTYRTTIFKQLFGYNPDITCGLNHSLTKQRFIMMTQSHRGKGAWLRLAATFPAIAAAFIAFGCGTKEAKASNEVSTNLTNGTETTYFPICPPCDATVSNSFNATGAGHAHTGIDYVLNDGAPVYAAADGEISSITRDDGNGLMLVLKHEDGYETMYAHLSQVDIASPISFEGPMMKCERTYKISTDADHSGWTFLEGEVAKGQLIGYAGSTGRATGPHLHFEVRKDGEPVDPAPLFTSDKPATAAYTIYVVEGNNKPGEEYFAICNGKHCMINDEISEAVSSYFEGKDKDYMSIQLKTEAEIPAEVMGKVAEQLRKTQTLKVSKARVKHIHDSALIEVISDPDGKVILIDGVRHPLEEVAEVIGKKRDASEKPYDFTVHIKASGDTRMGIIDDIKLELRKCRALKVRYEAPDRVIGKRLPPAPQTDEVQVAEDFGGMDRRNIIVMKLNHKGEMFLGSTYVKGSLHNDELYRKELDRLKELISNPEDRAECPDSEMKDVLMPDGSVRQFRVSNGIVSFQRDRATPYDDYTKAMELIMTAYKELREVAASDVFGKSLSELTDAEMQVIYQAVPMNVSEIEPKTVPARK